MGWFVISLVAAISVCPCLGVSPGPLYKRTFGDIWPQPFHTVIGDTLYSYDPSALHFKAEGEKCSILSEAAIRYRYILQRQSRGQLEYIGSSRRRSNTNGTLPQLDSIVLKLLGTCENDPYLGMDESYRLDVVQDNDQGVAKIQGNSVWGILRGLESFSQLSYFNKTIHRLYIREIKVWDKPRFPHRGIMIDTSRHYLNKRTIKQMIEAMEYNKYNVLHWHITDDQSFPYKSNKFPHLSERGAYSEELIYNEDDIREIIGFARKRGIRVIPEFDTPGHTQSWGMGQPGFLTSCYTGSKPNGLYGPVDPSLPYNYLFLEQLFTEIVDIYPDSHFHFGGDEVDFSCWQSNPQITEFMKKQGIRSNYAKLESLYINKVLDIAHKLNVTPVVWQEVFLNDRNLSNNTIVHIWTGDMKNLLTQVTSSGRQALLSTCWYLDHFTQDLYAGGGDWQHFYLCEPLDFPGTEEMRDKVLGGEACMWGEYVDDTNIIQRVWPRACAPAEKLWSWQFNVTMAANRLEEHVCRLRSRGIMAQPPNGPSVC